MRTTCCVRLTRLPATSFMACDMEREKRAHSLWKMMICTHAMIVKHAQMHVIVHRMNTPESTAAPGDL